MNKKRMRQAFVALIAGAALLSAPLAAYAAPPNTGSTTDAPWSDAGKNYTGSITVHKYMSPDGPLTGVTNDGTEQTGDKLAGLKPVEAVPYEVRQLTKITYTVVKTDDEAQTQQQEFNVDVKDFDTWTKLAGLVKQLNAHPGGTTLTLTEPLTALPEGYKLANPATATLVYADGTTQNTDNSGVATFNNLAIGLYRVSEGDTATAKVDGKVLKPAPTKAQPFFMAIPIAEQNKSYLYTTHVYPKNQIDSVSKTFAGDATGYVPGDKVSYAVTATINATTVDGLDGYAIYDNASNTGFSEAKAWAANNETGKAGLEATVTKVEILDHNGTVIMNGDAQKYPLDKSADYTVSLTAGADGTADTTRVQVNFTSAGLAKIAAAKVANPGAQVRVTYTFTIDPGVSKGTNVENHGGFMLGQPAGNPEPNPDVPTPGGDDPVLHFKDFTLTKVDAADSAKKLGGAQFRVFSTQADAEACAANLQAEQCQKSLTVNPQANDENQKKIIATSADAGALGTVTMPHISDGTYYLVEIKAPDKYLQAPKPITITLSHVENENTYTATVTNVAMQGGEGWFGLPQTGSTGVVILVILGAVLIFGGAGLFVYVAKRRKEQEPVA
ncbi:MAG: SpaH/EbpB family LPXTG-anchored major pilin [Arcanobacterium sp.]|nr:SpaH/EbpB family LPXTG-anchored major pilin [Arcanobacterium sp.]